MPKVCAVVKCKSRSDRDVGMAFYSFPRVSDRHGREIIGAAKRKELWAKALRRHNFTEKQAKCAYICQKHFVSGAPSELEDHPDYFPTLTMGYRVDRKKIMEKYEQFKRESTETIVIECSYPEDKSIFASPNHSNSNPKDIDITYSPFEDNSTQTEDILPTFKLTKQSFVRDDEKTKFLTGIASYEVLMEILSLIEPYIRTKSDLNDNFNIMIMTFIKLRFNFPFQYLGYQFNIPNADVQKMFYDTIEVMYFRLKTFVFWPSRQNLLKSKPNCFKEAFGDRIAVIVDCLDIQVDNSVKMEAGDFNRKKNNTSSTAKVLIGITLQGTVGFISEPYEGDITNTELMAKSGVLDNLLPGDHVLAERGFLVDNEEQFYFATVAKEVDGKEQVEDYKVDSARMEEVMVHVENIINTIRQKYGIINGNFPLFMVTEKDADGVCLLNKILNVCAACVNLCASIIG